MLFKNKEVAICFVANVAYLQHFAACLHSFVNHHEGFCHVFLFSDDATENHIAPIQANLKNQAIIEIIKVKQADFKGFSGFWQQFGRQVFYRFVIPDYLPKQFDYALYLDVDMIILDQLQFDDHTFNLYALAAVEDSLSNILGPKRGLSSYFNSGLLFIDVPTWRQKNISKLLFTTNPPIRRFADQEILNEYFKNAWHELPLVYNYPASKCSITLQGFRAGAKHVVIMHFNGGIKPWKYWQTGSLLYWIYIWRTPYKWQVVTIPKTIFASVFHKIKKISTS